MPVAHRVDGVLPGEQPAPVEPIPLVVGVPPPGPQALEQHRGEHGIAILATLALFDAQRHAGAVDVADLEGHHFAGAQPGTIGHRQDRLVLRCSGRRDQACDFLAAQYHRQLARLAHRAHPGQCLRAIQRHAKEEPQGGDRGIQHDMGGTGLDQVQLIAAQVFGCCRIG
jgi:hypothetical protein